MTLNVVDFLAGQGIEVDEKSIKHYGVKGMKWGVNKSSNDESGGGANDEIDKFLDGVDGGGDIDDMDLEVLGANIDAAISGKKEVDYAQRLIGRDKGDGFFEKGGRVTENVILTLLGKRAQSQRNQQAPESMKKAAARAVKQQQKNVDGFIKDIFKKANS